MATFYTVVTTDASNRPQDVALSALTMAPTQDITVPANKSAVVMRSITITSGKRLILESGARLGIL